MEGFHSFKDREVTLFYEVNTFKICLNTLSLAADSPIPLQLYYSTWFPVFRNLVQLPFRRYLRLSGG